MKKKIALRCLLGAPIGLAISTIITIIISLSVNDGNFYPVVPQLIDECKTELHAVLLQAACSLLYGAAWGGASLIWENEKWSLLRQTAVHLAVCSLSTFPIAYFMHWMNHSAVGITLYFGAFLIIYFFVWLTQYYTIKRRVQQLNDKVRAKDIGHS